MRLASCSKEAAVSMAVRTGKWEESLATHTAQCAVCRQVMQTARWMQAVARSMDENPALPDPALLWSRAQLTETLNRKQAEAETAQKILDWTEVALPALLAIGLGVWGFQNGQVLDSALSWLFAASLPQNWITAYHVASSNPAAIWSTMGVACLAALFLAPRILAAE